MDVLSSRFLLRPVDLLRSQRFYRDTLGLAVAREFGDPAAPGLAFFLGGGGFLEVSGRGTAGLGDGCLWLQVRDVAAEHDRLAALDVPVLKPPTREPWGLVEAWFTDPDGVSIVLVEIPADHPIRRDTR